MSRIKHTVCLLWLLFMVATAYGLPQQKDGNALLHQADSLYRMGHYDQAVALYEQAAQAGNAEAQFDIGYAYYTGEGTTRNYTSAAMWFKRAAKQQFAKAQYNLAYCYMNGRGVPRDYDKAYDLLRASAENNYKRAQLTLADCFEKGILVEHNQAESDKWKARAEAKKAEPATVETALLQVAPPSDVASPAVTPTESKASAGKEVLKGDFSVEVSLPNTISHAATEAPAPKPQQTETAVKPNVILGPKQLKEQAENQVAATSGTAVASQPIAAATATRQAPILKILFPEDQSLFHTDQVKLKYQLITGGCTDSTRVVVMVDGQRQPTTRAVRAANTIDVDLPHHDCTVMMYAQNSNGNSEPATIRLVRETSSFELPKLFVVAIGVGDYNDPKLPKLRFTTKDAQDFAKAIATKKGLPYEDVQVKVLCDSEATRADIFEAMEWLKQESSPNDVCIFFYAGHGLRDEKDRFYFMPYGCSSSKLYECFSASDFRNEAEDINGKLIAFVDACYSGALFEGGRSAATAHFVEQLKRSKNGMLLYASSSSDTKSREDESWGNGAFTKALVEALNGAARDEHAEGLSTQELEHFLYKEVRKITDFKQTPIFINPNGIEHFNIFNYEK